MTVFQVSSSVTPTSGPPKPRVSQVRRRRTRVALTFLIGGSIIALLVTLLTRIGLAAVFFILLPTLTTIITTIITARARIALRRLLFTAGLALVYFGVVSGWELLTHGPQTSELIVVTTTLALAVLFQPLRDRGQAFMEQGFNLRDDAAAKIITAFAATLREEIDLDQIRGGLLAAVQQAMQPQSDALWLQLGAHDEATVAPSQLDGLATGTRALDLANGNLPMLTTTEVAIDDDDPLIAYALGHPGALELARLQLDSPLVRELRARQVELALPLASQGELLGLFTLGPRLDGLDYSREDRDLLTTLAAQVAPALRVAQLALAQQAQVRKQTRIEQELQTARRIQESLLPKELPSLDGWSVATCYQPAREVGGDFYDFLSLPDGRLGLILGDVSDKGMPAALVMATTISMLRGAATQREASPGQVLAQVNDLLTTDLPPGMFVTCFYAILDPATGRLDYANAGQDLPYLRHVDGSVGELDARGMPLGLLPAMGYDEQAATLAPGDSLLFYSDGLVEAHNPQREMFGFPRLMALLSEQDGAADGRGEGGEEHTQAPLIPILLHDLATFTGANWEQEDDLTLVSLRRDAAPVLSANRTV